jgi:hypothetical protein
MHRADQPIVFISHNRVRPGMAQPLRDFLAAGAAGLADSKPMTKAFLAYLDAAGTRLTIVHAFHDAAGFAAHVEGSDDRSAVADAFIESASIEIYGPADAATLDAIRRGLVPGVGVEVHAEFVAGFLR